MGNVRIKYFKGSFKAANQKRCLKEFLLFLMLKQGNRHGKILYGNSIETICSLTNMSKGSASMTLKSAIEKGFIKVFKDNEEKIYCYQLVSYLEAYRKVLGLRFKTDNGFLPEHYIQRLNIKTEDNGKNLKRVLQFIEILWKFKDQQWQAKQKAAKNKYLRKDIVLELEEHGIVKTTLSYDTIKNMLGYKTKASALKAMSMLEKSSMIKIVKNGIAKMMKMGYNEFCQKALHEEFSYLNKMAYRYNCNTLQINLHLASLYLRNDTCLIDRCDQQSLS